MVQKQTQNFTCTGLSNQSSFTLWVNKDHCWATSGIPQDRFDALFKWAKSDDTFWKQNVIVMCEFDGYSEDGFPINAKVIEVLIKVK